MNLKFKNIGDKCISIKLNTPQDVKDFCFITSSFKSNIYVCSEKYKINAKSILGLFSLNLSETLTVIIEDHFMYDESKRYFKDIEKYIYTGDK